MANQAALASLDDIKTFMEVAPDVDDFDQKLLALLRTATRQIEKATRSEFVKQERTETFDAHCYYRHDLGVVPNVIRLKARPIDFGETFTVHHDPLRVFGSDTLLTIADDYYYDTDKEHLFVTKALTASLASVRVVYTGGYAVVDPDDGNSEDDLGADDANMSAAAPEALRMACVVQTMFLWTKVRTDSIGVREFDDGGQIATSFNLTPEAADLAMPYSNLVM